MLFLSQACNFSKYLGQDFVRVATFIDTLDAINNLACVVSFYSVSRLALQLLHLLLLKGFGYELFDIID